MQIRVDDKIKVIELARALAEVGLTIRSRDGEAVIERGRMEPLPRECADEIERLRNERERQ